MGNGYVEGRKQITINIPFALHAGNTMHSGQRLDDTLAPVWVTNAVCP